MAPSLQPTKTLPSATVGEDTTSSITVAFHRSLAEFAVLSLFAELLWVASWRNIDQLSSLEAEVMFERADIKQDRTKIMATSAIVQMFFFIGINKEPCQKQPILDYPKSKKNKTCQVKSDLG
jgi:hypothetical protein